jgi:hypothetical protein
MQECKGCMGVAVAISIMMNREKAEQLSENLTDKHREHDARCASRILVPPPKYTTMRATPCFTQEYANLTTFAADPLTIISSSTLSSTIPFYYIADTSLIESEVARAKSTKQQHKQCTGGALPAVANALTLSF